jgi:hypothetical protein
MLHIGIYLELDIFQGYYNLDGMAEIGTYHDVLFLNSPYYPEPPSVRP